LFAKKQPQNSIYFSITADSRILTGKGFYGVMIMKMDEKIKIDYKKHFRTLQKVNAFISQISNLNRLLDLIMEESKNILEAEASSLLLYDRTEKLLYFQVVTGKKGEKVKKFKLKMGEGIAGTAAKERKIINIADASKDKRFFEKIDKKSKFKTKSILAMPIVRKKKLIGVLEVLNKKNGKSFNKSDVELMEIISDQAGLAIENAYLYRENLKSARLAGVGQTMLSLSHDIKNILTGLCGGINVLEEGLQTSEKEYIDEGWKMVKNNVDRISDLIMDMLNFSSKKRPLYQKIKINSFLKETCAVYQKKMEEKNCSFVYQFDETLGEVEIDYQGLQRAFLNLINNAYEVIPESKGKITVKTKALSGNKFCISFSDNGPGIPKDKLKKIFEVFYTTKGHKGTGLGLPIVEKIVKEHKGKIEITSTQGKGTEFTITLPVTSGK
jgi:two-component system, NtrC family, sensor kinase